MCLLWWQISTQNHKASMSICFLIVLNFGLLYLYDTISFGAISLWLISECLHFFLTFLPGLLSFYIFYYYYSISSDFSLSFGNILFPPQEYGSRARCGITCVAFEKNVWNAITQSTVSSVQMRKQLSPVLGSALLHFTEQHLFSVAVGMCYIFVWECIRM